MNSTSNKGQGVRRGDKLGELEIGECIGVGGMGTVYVATMPGSSRRFAVKVLNLALADDEEAQRMLIDEARIASAIDHVNVAPVLWCGTGSVFYMVMDHIEGETVAALQKEAHQQRVLIPVRVALSVVSQMLAGLGAAHARGVVHRDVSPRNVLVGQRDGTARVLDFGIAYARERLTQTRLGLLKGTPSYMAPEQMRGRATPRSDVFAAGAMLWELLTGLRLIAARGIEQRLATAYEPPNVAEILWDPIASVVARAIDPDPQRRFADGDEFRRALEAAASTLGLSLSPLVVVDYLRSVEDRRAADVTRVYEPGRAQRDSAPAATPGRPSHWLQHGLRRWFGRCRSFAERHALALALAAAAASVAWWVTSRAPTANAAPSEPRVPPLSSSPAVARLEPSEAQRATRATTSPSASARPPMAAPPVAPRRRAHSRPVRAPEAASAAPDPVPAGERSDVTDDPWGF